MSFAITPPCDPNVYRVMLEVNRLNVDRELTSECANNTRRNSEQNLHRNVMRPHGLAVVQEDTGVTWEGLIFATFRGAWFGVLGLCTIT